MSKYIVDTDDFEPMFKVDSIGVFGIGKSVTDNTEDHSWSRIKSLVDFEELNSDYINEHYGQLQDEAYNRGFEAGKKVSEEGCVGCEYADKVVTGPPCITCCNSYRNQWVAKKQDDEIKVGDEVDWSGDKFIVTRIFQPYDKAEECDGVDTDGCTYHDVLISGLIKTGRHVDITDMLKGALE